MSDSYQIVSILTPVITLLGLGIVAACAASFLRLNPIVGYLVLGFVLAALGYADTFEGPGVETLAEAGVMFLLFNLGLHFSLSKIAEEARNIFGFGALQMLVAGGGFTLIALLFGLPLPVALIVGAALGLSSTAVVIGIIRERDQQDCPVGRAAQSILIFQDIAAIALLVTANTLGGESGSMGSALAMSGLKAVAAFGIAVTFAKFLTAPLFRIIARANSSEVFTATALFLALAAGWATGAVGLSLTLGAFLGGMAIADSRYRVLVQTEIEAFRGLFLGFFFMTVGLSIDPQVLMSQWFIIGVLSLAFLAVKCFLNILAALSNRWSVAGSVQLGFLLGQGSEFALVIFAIPAVVAGMGSEASSILITIIAISLALTPPISNAGRQLAGKLRRGREDKKLGGDDAAVVILGMGKVGRSLADGLTENNVNYIAVEDENALFERAVADGYNVHLSTAGDIRTWQPLGMRNRELIVVTKADAAKMRELQPMIEDFLPNLIRIAALSNGANREAFEATGMRAIPADTDEEQTQLLHYVLGKLKAR